MLHPGIVLRESSIQGRGLFAAEFIPRGTVVWTLDEGERRLTLEELQALPEEEQIYAYQHEDTFIITSDNSKYWNHSCDPTTNGLGDTAMIAMRDIQPGEEITYDYATSEIDERFRPTWECRCGALNCRKTIRHTDCLDPEFQKKYEGGLSSWVLEFIRQHEADKQVVAGSAP